MKQFISALSVSLFCCLAVEAQSTNKQVEVPRPLAPGIEYQFKSIPANAVGSKDAPTKAKRLKIRGGQR